MYQQATVPTLVVIALLVARCGGDGAADVAGQAVSPGDNSTSSAPRRCSSI